MKRFALLAGLVLAALACNTWGAEPTLLRIEGSRYSLPIQLGSYTALLGDDPASSHLLADGKTTGAFISTKYETRAARFLNQGATVHVSIRNLSIDGRQGLKDAIDRNKGREYVCNGIEAHCSSAMLDNLHIRDFSGIGIRFTKGWQKRDADIQLGDLSMAYLLRSHVSHCLTGVRIEQADVMIDQFVACYCRDVGLDCKTGGQQIGMVHCYNNGVGVWLRQYCFASQIESEACRVALVNDLPGTTIGILRTQKTTEIGAHLKGMAKIGLLMLNANKGVGVQIEKLGRGTHISSGTMYLSGSATGILLRGNGCRINLTSYGGQRTLVIDEPVNNCQIDLALGGCPVGVEIQKLGKHNQIRVQSVACPQPVVLPEGGVHESNQIIVNGSKQ